MVQHTRFRLALLSLGFALPAVGAGSTGSHVSNVNVHPDFRRRGYGESLMKRAISDAANVPSAKSVYLIVRKSNEAAIALYEKLGFSIHKIGPEFYKEENGLDMRLALTPKRRKTIARAESPR